MGSKEKYTREGLDRFTNFVKLVKKARKFATDAHKGVYRNGLDLNGHKLEYITHPISVAKILHKYKSSNTIEILVAVCLLHDTVEDVDWVTIDVIRDEFGDLIASLVDELTSDPKGLEKYGKEEYLKIKMSSMSSWGLCIKLADRLHNLSDVDMKIKGCESSDIRWVVKYCNQTNNIIKHLEDSRTLSDTHIRLIDSIKEATSPAKLLL